VTDRDPSSDPSTTADATPAQPTPPILVAAFEGWNDAGDAATTAIEHLQLSWDATPLAEIDPDDYYDFQVTRPTVHMVDGVTRRVEWPTTRLTVCRPPGGATDVVLVHGIEPNMRWRRFCAELLEHVEQLGVTTVITLGALLADTPHTRPVPVTGTAYDTESANKYGLEHSRYEGPTGIVGVFQDTCVQAGIPAISIWAAVPHYVSQPPSPKATLALLHRVEELLDVEVPLGALPAQAEEWERTVSEMADEDEDVRNYVRALEERGDEIGLTETSGDAIAAEFERYLRRRGRGSGRGPGHGSTNP
jgi:proteasome assembly chaperone (PAC2) family protein